MRTDNSQRTIREFQHADAADVVDVWYPRWPRRRSQYHRIPWQRMYQLATQWQAGGGRMFAYSLEHICEFGAYRDKGGIACRRRALRLVRADGASHAQGETQGD